MYLTTFSPVPPYNFDLTLSLAARFTYPTLDIAGKDGAYWRAIRSGEGIGLFRVTPDLNVYLMAGKVDVDDALVSLSRILGINEDLRPFYAYAQSDPQLWAIVEPLQGIRILKAESIYEGLICLIIEQHISWVSAQRSTRALLEWADQRIDYEGQAFYTFPTPQQLAAATMDDLKPLKLTTKRTAALIEISQHITAGTLDIESLRHRPHEEAYKTLMGIKGVGHWTASYVLARALGLHPYIPDADVALQAAANLYFNGQKGKLTPAATRQLYERFGEFGGMASFYTMLRWIIEHYQLSVRS